MRQNKVLITIGFVLLVIVLFSLSVTAYQTLSYDDFECNDFSCGSGWNGAWSYTGTCEITTLSSPIGTYQMRGVAGCDATRNFDDNTYSDVNVSFWATATSLENNEYCRYYYFDGITDHELLNLTNGQDDGVLKYYSFNVTKYGVNSNAGIRMYGAIAGGDYCYIDNINISGQVGVDLNLYIDSNYLTGQTDVVVEADSSLTNTQHTIGLYYPNGTSFCLANVTSPAVPNTVFGTVCDMPTNTVTNAYAVLQVTGQTYNITKYFNVTQAQQDATKLDIKKVYFSPQVLQGGNTEIFAVINTGSNISVDSVTTTLTYSDGTTRILGMSHTVNAGEYRAFITDTYLTGITYFTIRAESGIYYDTYTNNYEVKPYNVDFVDTVNQVAKVLKVETQTPEANVKGTDYEPGDNGKIFLQLIEGNQSVKNAACDITVFYPDNTLWLFRQLMTYAPSSEGLYYYDFTVPNQIGVYMLSAICEYELLPSFADIYNVITNSTTIGPISGADKSDNTYYEIEEYPYGSEIFGLDADFVFENVTSVDVERIDVIVEAHQQSSSYLNISIYNFNTSTFEPLPSELLLSMTDASVSNSIFDNTSHYINSTNNSIVRLSIDPHIHYPTPTPFTFYDDNGVNRTAPVKTAEDANTFTSNIDGINRAHYIVAERNFTNSSFINFRVATSDSLKDIVFTNAAGTIQYGRMYLPVDAFGYYNVTLYNLTEGGVDTVYLSDLNQGGALSVTWDWIEPNTFNDRIDLYVDEVHLDTYYFFELPTYSLRGAGELNVRNKTSQIINSVGNVNSSISDILSDMSFTFIGGTEYSSGEEGKIALRLIKGSGTTATLETGATCTVDILYPNESVFVNSANMTEYGNGIYTYNFTTPSITGVYTYSTDCSVLGRTYYALNTFHVAGWADAIYEIQNTVHFINSTTIEINGTVTNIYSYLQGSIYSILQDINGSTSSDLTSVLTKLTTLQSVVDNMNDFTQEQIFLITDSVGQVQGVVKDTYSTEQDMQNALDQVQKNLKRFLEITPSVQDASSATEYTPGKNLISGIRFDYSIIVLVAVVLGILVLSHTNGLSKDKPKEKKPNTPQFALPSRHRRINYPQYKNEVNDLNSRQVRIK